MDFDISKLQELDDKTIMIALGFIGAFICLQLIKSLIKILILICIIGMCLYAYASL